MDEYTMRRDRAMACNTVFCTYLSSHVQHLVDADTKLM